MLLLFFSFSDRSPDAATVAVLMLLADIVRETTASATYRRLLSLICALSKHTYRITTCRLSLNCLFARANNTKIGSLWLTGWRYGQRHSCQVLSGEIIT